MKQLGLGIIIGAAVALAGSYLTGYLAAIALPAVIAESRAGLFLWELGAQCVGFGILAFALMVYAVKLDRQYWVITAAIAIISAQAVLAVLSWPDYSLSTSHTVVLTVFLALGGLASMRVLAYKSEDAP